MQLTIKKKNPLSSCHSWFNAENSRTLYSATLETSSKCQLKLSEKNIQRCTCKFYSKLVLFRLWDLHHCLKSSKKFFCWCFASLMTNGSMVRMFALSYAQKKKTKTLLTAESTSVAKCSVEKTWRDWERLTMPLSRLHAINCSLSAAASVVSCQATLAR